jgi:hypothetical protein
MMQLVKKVLLELVDRIDKGNSNLTEEECTQALEVLSKFTTKDEGMSKYSACRYLNISRATFDNLVKEGKIPTGKHVIGFKEKRWYIKDLEIFRHNCKMK